MFATKGQAYTGIGVTLTVAVGASMLSHVFDWGWPWYVALLLGLNLYQIGFQVRMYSAMYLGKNFSLSITVPQKLIITGPYRYIRHPMYLGTLIQAAGFGVLTLNWFGLGIVMGGIYVILSFRMRAEESLLLAQYGIDYTIYEVAVPKRLIPFVL